MTFSKTQLIGQTDHKRSVIGTVHPNRRTEGGQKPATMSSGMLALITIAASALAAHAAVPIPTARQVILDPTDLVH